MIKINNLLKFIEPLELPRPMSQSGMFTSAPRKLLFSSYEPMRFVHIYIYIYMALENSVDNEGNLLDVHIQTLT